MRRGELDFADKENIVYTNCEQGLVRAERARIATLKRSVTQLKASVTAKRVEHT